MSVGIVLVSHSAKLAEGLAELAAQMAPDVTIVAAGGLAQGGIGTDYDEVVAATQRADSGAGVVLLYDLGSAQMTADLAVESLADPSAAVVVDAPLVEGAIAAAVAAQGGADRQAVAGAAAAAGAPADLTFDSGAQDGESSVELTLRNDVGLHARPAAVLVRSIAGLDAQVTVRLGEETADANSVLALMALGARQGDRIEVRAKGAQAEEALTKVKDLVDQNFGE
ncbi:dihydroxyacetone kinase phosphoryl donor subunit DhaM [Amycolatopsis sp. BJA-103]|uniref:dihydroxyacetone kinase phosphoryl donor subunit DhaM n=1 Tax=Amycolatopsis sp. BJA-103 TaxID=1911175 RepID=UPI000C794416|nr:dihydroxyacetone kinase phosphoryl donor subunit DhaM [Amycolatopsis sp. BJA-103]AUI61306.1 PTS sugar transporter subunit IIA [Amycolatopsis sp. BJA-103]PNE21402.1 PTS sugar transporter subunit IIA [Amycolatopsis sp. BJA-103]